MSFNIEEFFNSIDVIVEQRLADLSYDTTVIATITDDSDKERGHYVVTDGTIRFDAYVNDMNYKTGDQVRVTIMNGDWSQKKFIIGLYTDNGTGQAVTYIPPLGNVFATDFSKTTASLNSNTSFTLYANNAETYKPVWGKQITKDSSEYILQANGIYNVITLSGDFQTNLGALSAGGYGLKLELYIQPEVNSTERIMKFVTFDSDEMIGNPYSFVIDSRQDKQFAIAEQGIVTEIILSVYQGVRYDNDNNPIDNSFCDKDGNKLFNSGTDYPIHFRNISVGFGSNLTEIEDKTLKIYTTNSATYKWNNGSGDETNDKRLGLVWYNKDELDGYVGFSDGIYDSDYDEIAYLKENYASARLIRNANKGNIANDELSLTLAANIEDSESYMQNAYRALTTDLAAELQALGRQLTGWQTLQTELNKFISAWRETGKDTDNPALLSDARNKAETAVENLVALYHDVLRHGYNLQNDGYKDEERSEAWNKITFSDYYTEFKNSVENVLTQLETFFTTMKTQTEVGQAMSGYRTVYSNYYNRAKIVMNAIKLDLSNVIHKSKVYGQEKEDYVWLQGFNTRTDEFPSYVKDEEYFATFANKYCIYWYRYNEKYNLQYIIPLTNEEWNALSNEEKNHSSYNEYVTACNKNNDEYQFGQFLGKNWERVQVDSSANPILNFGLPEAGDIIDGIQYLKTSSPTELLLYRRMEPTTEVEKYQVVLFYNHEMCKSNTLTFTNSQASEIPPEFAVDAADILRIEHDTYSQDHYQAYTQANDLVNIADESRIRQLKCYYEGVLCGDEALADADIFWYIPTNSTMLTYDRKYLIDKGFSTDDVEEDENGNTGKTEYSKNGYVYFSRTIRYTNTPTEVKDSEGNVIYDATGNAITEDNITINEPDKYFFYKIKPYYEAAAQNNTILVEAHIKKGEETKITTGEIPFTFSTFGTNGTKYTLVMVPNTTQISTFPHNDTNPNPDLTLELSLRDADNKLIPLNEAFVVAPDTIGGEVDEEDTPAIETYDLQLSWRTHNAALQNSGLILTPVGEDKTTYTITIPNPDFGTTNVPYVGVLNAAVMFNEELSNGEPRQIRLKTFYPVAYSSAIEADYYISGPTTIVYNNQGVVSRLTDEPYRLYQHTLDEGDIEITNCTWELAYFNADGSQLIEGNTEESRKIYKDLIAYMPKLNADNTLMPAPMYCALYDEEDNETFIVPVAVCKIGGDIVWTQPITITQNNYASSTLNEWNGEFEINEANGTILSTMVGAGRKNIDNQFEGVLMGDIERGTNFDTDNASGLGIYGFHNGAQSFHFGIDGKAFIGKAGRGRIRFDGNSGTIASASYYATRQNGAQTGDAGMLIDLDDGFIDIKGVSATGELDYTGSPTYEMDTAHQAHITLNAKADEINPFFRITSPRINPETEWENMDLIYVGLDEYYLQSSNYQRPDTAFEIADNQPNTPGSGMRIDLQGASIDAFNLRLQSQNILIDCVEEDGPYFVIKSGATDEELTSFRNLMYVGADTYYLQTADYQENTSGLKIDLANGTIKAYNSFSLVAGSETNGGIMLNASPRASENYLFAGKTSTGFIKVSGAGEMSLYATAFKLKVAGDNPIYLSNETTQWTVNDTERSNIVLGLGSNFGVDNKGNLYANNATINNLQAIGGSFSGNITSSATISGGVIEGGKIIGANIYGPTESGATFSLTSDGKLTCISAEIGGWSVSGGSSGFSSGSLYMSPSKGLGFGSNFSVDTQGNLVANGAVLNTLTVYQSLTVNSGSSSGGGGGGGDSPIGGGGGNANANTQIRMMSSRAVDAGGADGAGTGTSTSGASSVSNALVSINGSTKISGNTEITGTLKINSNTSIGGNTDISGTVTIGTTGANTSLTVNGTNTITGNTTIGGQLTVPSGYHIYLSGQGKDEGDITLLDYIRENSDSLIDLSLFGVDVDVIDLGSLFGASTGAENLVSNKTITLAAPPSAPSEAGLFLKSTGSSATTAWSSIAPSDISHSADNNGKVLGVTGGSADWKTIGATLVNFSDGTTTGITRQTDDDGNVYYQISATGSGTVTKTSKTGYVSDVYLCWNGDPTNWYVPTAEVYSADAASAYDHYTKVSSSGRKYSYYTTPDSVSVTTTKNVKINVSLT